MREVNNEKGIATNDPKLSVVGSPSSGAVMEPADSLKYAIFVLDKKVRNLEKKKGKIEKYRKDKHAGKELNEDQIQAVNRHEETNNMLTATREMKKQFEDILSDINRHMKKQSRKTIQAEKEMKRILPKDIIRVHEFLRMYKNDSKFAEFAVDHIVDFLTSKRAGDDVSVVLSKLDALTSPVPSGVSTLKLMSDDDNDQLIDTIVCLCEGKCKAQETDTAMIPDLMSAIMHTIGRWIETAQDGCHLMQQPPVCSKIETAVNQSARHIPTLSCYQASTEQPDNSDHVLCNHQEDDHQLQAAVNLQPSQRRISSSLASESQLQQSITPPVVSVMSSNPHDNDSRRNHQHQRHHQQANTGGPSFDFMMNKIPAVLKPDMSPTEDRESHRESIDSVPQDNLINGIKSLTFTNKNYEQAMSPHISPPIPSSPLDPLRHQSYQMPVCLGNPATSTTQCYNNAMDFQSNSSGFHQQQQQQPDIGFNVAAAHHGFVSRQQVAAQLPFITAAASVAVMPQTGHQQTSPFDHAAASNIFPSVAMIHADAAQNQSHFHQQLAYAQQQQYQRNSLEQQQQQQAFRRNPGQVVYQQHHGDSGIPHSSNPAVPQQTRQSHRSRQIDMTNNGGRYPRQHQDSGSDNGMRGVPRNNNLYAMRQLNTRQSLLQTGQTSTPESAGDIQY